jgi:hypothetical protein
MGVLVALMIALLVVCIVQGQPIVKVLVLAALIVPLALLLFESFIRRVVINQDGVTAFRFFRQTQILFANVTSLETVRVRSRVFMTLAAGDDDFLIISNSYAGFPALVEGLIAAVPEESVTEETQQLAEKPPLRHADVFTVWFAVIALVYILVAQFKV